MYRLEGRRGGPWLPVPGERGRKGAMHRRADVYGELIGDSEFRVIKEEKLWLVALLAVGATVAVWLAGYWCGDRNAGLVVPGGPRIVETADHGPTVPMPHVPPQGIVLINGWTTGTF